MTARTMRVCVPQRQRFPASALLHLLQVRFRRLIEQRLRRHDHAVGAIAALRGLLGDEGRLEGVGLLGRAQSLESRNRAARGLPHRSDAGARGFSLDQNRASPALSEPATEFRTVQADRVAQHIEKRLGRIPGFDRNRTAVQLETILRHRASSGVRVATFIRYYTPIPPES